MIEIAILALLGWLFYVLFVKGAVWPILLFIIATCGGSMLVEQYFPATKGTVATFMSFHVSWAAFICALIVILAIGVIMGDNE